MLDETAAREDEERRARFRMLFGEDGDRAPVPLPLRRAPEPEPEAATRSISPDLVAVAVEEMSTAITQLTRGMDHLLAALGYTGEVPE